MGGSGRSSRINLDASDIVRAIDGTRERLDASELAQLFADVVAELNQYDREVIERHKETVLDTLSTAFDDVIDLRLGGSRKRRTDVDSLSDIDLLVEFGPYSSCTLSNKESKEAVLKDMAVCLRQRLPRTKISVGRMAVTIEFSDGHELQVLPAFRYHGGHKVPDPHGHGWVVTRPQVFAQLLRDRNDQVGGRLLRTIKLSKLICANSGIDIKSYHLENLTVKAFEHYTGQRSDPAMLRHLFNQAKKLVMRPMRDITGQDTHVDGYLTDDGARTALARRLDEVERRIESAGETPSAWRKIINA